MKVQDLFQTLGVLAAIAFSTYQIILLRKDANRRECQRREETALQLHRDITMDGEAAAGCRRLSLSLRARGMQIYGTETWSLVLEEDFNPGGLLDSSSPENQQNYADVYRTMWYFERVYTVERSDLVDSDLLFSLIGFHVWWWNQILRNVRHPVVMRKVIELGHRSEVWAASQGRLQDWVQRCRNDFDNAGAKALVPSRVEATPPDSGVRGQARAESSAKKAGQV
jgi:hypothetical protein